MPIRSAGAARRRCCTYAKRSWYIRTTAVQERLVEPNNQQIHWVPEHIKNGRFGNWLENNVDWALSRERYWGTPLPIWTCDGLGGYVDAIGSRGRAERTCRRKTSARSTCTAPSWTRRAAIARRVAATP